MFGQFLGVRRGLGLFLYIYSFVFLPFKNYLYMPNKGDGGGHQTGAEGSFLSECFYEVGCSPEIVFTTDFEWSSDVNSEIRNFVMERGNWQNWVFEFCFGVVFSCNNLREINGYKEIVSGKPAL